MIKDGRLILRVIFTANEDAVNIAEMATRG